MGKKNPTLTAWLKAKTNSYPHPSHIENCRELKWLLVEMRTICEKMTSGEIFVMPKNGQTILK